MRFRPGDLASYRGGPGFVSLSGSLGVVMDVVELRSSPLDPGLDPGAPVGAGLVCLILIGGQILACPGEELEALGDGCEVTPEG